MDNINEKDIKRFESFYREHNGCKLWINKLDKDGYGTFYFIKKNRRAHRVAYYLKYGDIPSGFIVDHICKNRNCVNTEHLRLVTIAQNNIENSRSVGAINKNKTHCKNGHPFDKKYGKQRYCSICQNEKSKRLHKKWREEANKIKC